MRQRGANSWELRVYRGVDPDSKRPRYPTRTVQGTKRVARAALEELAAEADQARAHKGSFGELLDLWLEAAGPRWSASTRRTTLSIIGRHLRPAFGHVPLARVTTASIDTFYGSLQIGSEALATATVQRIHVVLHRALGQAVRWGWIYSNPASDSTPPAVQPAEIRPPSVEQVSALLTFVADQDPGFFLYLCLAAFAGPRRSQLLGLRWRDVDVEHGALAIQRALIDAAGGPVLQATKNRRPNRVAIDDATLALLVERRRRVSPETLDCFVFSRDDNGIEPCKPNWVTKQFIRYRRDAGLEHFRMHDLRHFMATTMLARGVPVVTVAERLGHARASTTLNVYAHSVPGADRDAAGLVAGLVRRHMADAS